jgi:hypothetical protein
LISFVRWLRSENFLIHSSRNNTKKRCRDLYYTRERTISKSG